jgi:dTDP-4-dehydrorhamnose reductase
MRVLVTGASGNLGGYLLRQLQGTGHAVTAWNGSRECDLCQPATIRAAFAAARPDVVLHAAALATVAACHRDPDRARRVNVDATALLADLCAAGGARLVFVSTDLVFDGDRGDYAETDEPAPLSVYGRSKRAAELAVLTGPRHLVVRVSLLFGPTLTGRPAFFDEQVRALRQRQPVTCFTDEWRTPLSLTTAAQALTALLTADVNGVLHLGGRERLSRLDMARHLAAHLGADPAVIVAASRTAVAAAAEPRPRDTALNSARWRGLFPDHPWPTFAAALRELKIPPP